MFGPANKRPKPSHLKVTLDGQTVELPLRSRASLAAVRAQLELLALRRERVLYSLVVDGAPVNLAQPCAVRRGFRQVTACSVSFEQRGLQILATATERLEHLCGRVEALALLVVINEPAVAQRLWWEMLPEIKEPLLLLSFLPELVGKFPAGTAILAPPLVGHVHRLGVILHELDLICARFDTLELSNALDHRLLPWLRQLTQSLKPLHEPAAA
jgi:hypothetical protein